MSRMLAGFLLAFLLMAPPLPALTLAQQGDAAYFESFEGLQRIVARSWMAPITVIETSTTQDLDEAGTPIPGTLQEATPSASPVPQSGVGMLSIFVYLFDSDEDAATAWERLDGDLQKTVERDPRAPMMEDLPLEGVGDQARGYMGDLTSDGVTVRHTFATVQEGPFVYSISGMFSGVDGADLTRGYAEALVSARMDRMAEQFHPDGMSRGGIWRKLNAVQPEMPDGSMVTDFEIWPTPEGALAEPTAMTMDELVATESVTAFAGQTYLPEDGATGGPARIDAWIIETTSVEDGTFLIFMVADALGSPIAVIASENGFEGAGDNTDVLVAMEGFVTDDAMPEGNASVVVRQVGTTIYAAVVYAPDDTTRRVADNVVDAMIDAPDDGDLNERFPEAGDGVLRGLVPAGMLPATPSATPGANAGSGTAG